ncbi:A/G-specific adenine glycosylase [Kingella negevensis]|uniref:A/G-specific adenine glycosylase n=1 Tax=Kingella negevensis TaxID=1522312 RepID=UPI002543F189|nr:A/G-specific adenine glycosylase [Kingella negevensis]WII92911.1 A/G-specific adenine glycosylase [Kingella negevensis]
MNFSFLLITWQKQYGRHHLPWQVSDPYRVWLSEIMLQQTQVITVLDYYPRFVARFPTVQDLAAAPQDDVLQLWAGLGYYSRARNLHFAAQQVVNDFGGTFPANRVQLESLKGVGRSTAAAICAFAFRLPETILDGNVKRVLCRVFALDGDPSDKAFERDLWAKAESLLPENRADMPAYTQGLMDLGATVCTRSKPRCEVCPMNKMCQALAQDLTAELPRKKAAVAVQQQTLFWLIAQREDGAIWLHKRPQRGIWAGLYCVPTFDSLAQMGEGVTVDELEELPALTHRLTHRLLEIIPYRANTFSGCVNNGIWVLPSDFAAFGMPKPLANLLQNLCTNSVDKGAI